MKRTDNKKENNEIMQCDNYYDFLWCACVNPIRLRKCNAYIGKEIITTTATNHFGIIPLKSYNTIVAYIINDYVSNEIICIDVLRLAYGYTATSAQHISKFFHEMTALHHDKKITYLRWH